MTARELLRLAAVLAGNQEGSPRWVARSRAVSTAYYALFHAVAELCARELVGARRPWPPFRHVYRSLDHAQARRVFYAVQREAGSSEEAKKIAGAFVDIQELRHDADYDPGFRISGIDVATVLARVERAVHLLDQLEPAERKFLSARLIGRTRS